MINILTFTQADALLECQDKHWFSQEGIILKLICLILNECVLDVAGDENVNETIILASRKAMILSGDEICK